MHTIVSACCAAVTKTEPVKPAAATGKKRDVQTPECQNHTGNGHVGSRQRGDDAANVRDRQISPSTKNDVAVHAAKRKKLARNGKLIGSDGLDELIPTTDTSGRDTSGADRKSMSTTDVTDRSETTGTKLISADRVQSPTAVAKTRDDTDTAVETNKTGHVTSEKQEERQFDMDAPSTATTGSSLVAVKANDKDRADILDDIEDDVAGTFAFFAQIKSTSGVTKAAYEELPVSQPQQPSSETSRTDSYDQQSTGGAAFAMGDSGYQTYDHDLSALDGRQSQVVPDQPSSAKPEVTSELELQSSISEPDMGDTAARYSASSDSEISVELPSCASSSGADKPTSLDWQLPQAASTTHDDTPHSDDRQSWKLARRASEEDLDQIRSACLFNFIIVMINK